MRWLIALVGLALAACQQPIATTPSLTPRALDAHLDLVYVRDQNAPRYRLMDWSGAVHGSVPAAGFSQPSADGARFIRVTDQLAVEDSSGHRLGRLQTGLDSYGLGTWADDGRHFCAIVFPANTGPDAGQGSLWVGIPGQAGRVVGPVGRPGSDPGVAACSINNDRAIVAGGLFPHWPAGGTRYLITAEIQVVNLSTGAVEMERAYPVGNTGGQLEVGARGEWVHITASPDARYLAESGIFNGTTTIRDATTGKPLATLARASVLGFSWAGDRVVAVSGSGSSAEARLVGWGDGGVIWRRAGLVQMMLARPNAADVMVGMVDPVGGLDDLIVVNAAGSERTIARNAMVEWPCPCPPGV